MKYCSRIVWGLVMVLTFFCNDAKGQKLTELSQTIIPAPLQTEDAQDQSVFNLDGGVKIVSDNLFLSQYLSSHLDNLLGELGREGEYSASEKSGTIVLDIKEGTPRSFTDNEQYIIHIEENKITISGFYSGVFNGIQTLLQLLPPQVYNSGNKEFAQSLTLPAGKIFDVPKYSYRGFHLDVARTFVPLDKIYKLVDYMSYHKINKFHWHLTDDQGWRPEIKSLPLLTQIGGFRGENLPLKNVLQSGKEPYGGYYTQEQMRDVVEFAAKRNIEIIPEIDIPGHSMSEAVAYPDILCSPFKDSTNSQTEYSREIWCVTKESNYEMLDSIIRELAQIFTTTQYINIGGDEVNHENWKHCPDCQALMQRKNLKDEYELHNYFIHRCDKIAHKYGKRLMGWEEVMAAKEADPQTLVVVWKSKKPIKQALMEQHPFVLQVAEYSYYDMKQSPLERGHDWAGLVPLEKAYELDPVSLCNEALKNEDISEQKKVELRENSLMGVQAGLWQELGIRPHNYVEYQYFPRICTISEIGWNSKEKEEYDSFYNKLTNYHFRRLENMGIEFRVPPPAVEARKIGKRRYEITATAPYKDAVIKYAIVPPYASTNAIRGEEDTTNYKYIYTKPIRTKNIANYRFATFTKEGGLHSYGAAVQNMPLYEPIKPKFEIETNLDTLRNFCKFLSDYNANTLARVGGRVKAGGYVTFVLDEPIECSVIDIVTGRPSVDFYGVQYGFVEYSLDGINYTRGGTFEQNRSVTLPKGKFKYVRINITGETDCRMLYFTPPLFY